MISSISVVFLATCYVYYKQYYKELIDKQVENESLNKIWTDKLVKKLFTFLLGVGVVVTLYIISFTIIKLSPATPNVKLLRRVADLGAVMMCVVLFYLDKKELDKKFIHKAPTY